jgi:DNA polymerase/3'-5' exonuclease PolX
MKKIVLVALLAVAAGCGSKKTGADCDAAIAKGIENFSKNVKEHAPNPQIVERMMGMMDKLKGVLAERCKADSWPPEVVSCFTTVNNRKDMQACQSKLSPEQASKLTTEITQVMMTSGGMGMGQRMPPGMAGHPEALAGSGAGAAGGAAPSGTPAAPAAPAAPAGSDAPK